MNQENNTISLRIERVRSLIADALQRSGRTDSSVELVAISKGQSIEKIREAHAAGLRIFGENRVYEALPKIEELNDLSDIEWHMVGHIQSRKARDVVPHFSMVQSIDRLKIAHRLNRYASEARSELKVLLECNVSGEETKEGWILADRANWSDILPVLDEILGLENLHVCGLMTMAPWTSDVELLRSVFKRLREFRDYIANELPGDWRHLSMGMTDDYEIAVEEGSTMVRIGRAIFGPRT
ncbi:MAG: YggS family pyridoxal phosphate-dependent enzyme [Anaerolineales bacterium]|nr:YggS family pyridoxal phosphate-dependent enzyme [Anaerolineales bacterium]